MHVDQKNTKLIEMPYLNNVFMFIIYEVEESVKY